MGSQCFFVNTIYGVGVSVWIMTSIVGDGKIGEEVSVGVTVGVVVAGVVAEGSGSVAVDVGMMVAVCEAVTITEAVDVGVLVYGIVLMLYSMCNNGATAASSSYATATRLLEEPVMMMDREFPDNQPA